MLHCWNLFCWYWCWKKTGPNYEWNSPVKTKVIFTRKKELQSRELDEFNLDVIFGNTADDETKSVDVENGQVDIELTSAEKKLFYIN